MGNAGSSQPKNRTGRKVVEQKLENAKKTCILSLREHKLEEIPDAVFQITALKTLDLSKNNLKSLSPKLATLTSLKSLNCDENQLIAGSLSPIEALTKLQNLSLGGNRLGKPVVAEPGKKVLPTTIQHIPGGNRLGKPAGAKPGKAKANPAATLPTLPPSLKQLKLDANFFSSIPPQICSPTLTKLEKLDLSNNQLAAIPSELCTSLVALNELNLDNNSIVALPEAIGSLPKLKSLSLKNNQIRVSGSTTFSTTNPQPLPASLFTNTPLIDLNLHGNPMTSTQLNEFEGYADFLKRRQKVKTTALYGGAMTNLSVTGLE